MNRILEQYAMPALHRCGVHFERAVGHDVLVINMRLGVLRQRSLRVTADANDEHATLTLQAELCTVPPVHRSPAALLLAQINCRSLYVMFSMADDGCVLAAVTVDVADSRMPERRIMRAFDQLLEWIRETYGEISCVARYGQRRRPSRLEQEVAQILADAQWS